MQRATNLYARTGSRDVGFIAGITAVPNPGTKLCFPIVSDGEVTEEFEEHIVVDVSVYYMAAYGEDDIVRCEVVPKRN